MYYKTAVIKREECIEIDSILLPPLSPEMVRVRVYRAGICGTDYELYKGTMPYLKNKRISYPLVPGHEWAGKVMEVGNKVKDIQKGDRVSGELHLGCGNCANCKKGRYNLCSKVRRIGIGDLPGAFAEYIQLPEKLVHKLPPSISFKQGSLIEPTAVALQAVSLLSISGGEKIIIFGAGPIGLMAVNAVKVYGAGEIILVLHQHDKFREQIGRKLGANRCISFEEISQETENYFDLGVEASGSKGVISYLFYLVKPGGRLSFVGMFKDPVPNLDISKLVIKSLTAYGSLGSAGIWENTIRLIQSSDLHPEFIVTHEFEFIEIIKTFKNMEKLKREGLIKASIII